MQTTRTALSFPLAPPTQSHRATQTVPELSFGAVDSIPAHDSDGPELSFGAVDSPAPGDLAPGDPEPRLSDGPQLFIEDDDDESSLFAALERESQTGPAALPQLAPASDDDDDEPELVVGSESGTPSAPPEWDAGPRCLC